MLPLGMMMNKNNKEIIFKYASIIQDVNLGILSKQDFVRFIECLLKIKIVSNKMELKENMDLSNENLVAQCHRTAWTEAQRLALRSV